MQKKEIIEKFVGYLESYEKKILPDLLKKHKIDPATFVQVVISEIKKSEKLLEAFMDNPSSLFASIISGAEIGLIPSDMLGEFFLIPRNMKQKDGKYKLTVTPLLGYKGLVNILLRSGEIVKIHAEVVYEGDEFGVEYGLNPSIFHSPKLDLPRTADKIKYVYAVAKFKNNEFQFSVMTRAEIEAVNNLSKFPNDLYFNDKMGVNRWMEKKCALIQLSKLLPKDYYSKKAIGLDNLVESGATLTLDEQNEIKLIEAEAKSKSRYRSIYDTLGSLDNAEEIQD
jgi:recombination protein RecT